VVAQAVLAKGITANPVDDHQEMTPNPVRIRWIATALAVACVAGCGGSEDVSLQPARPLSAPAHAASRLAFVRLRTGDLPRPELVASGLQGEKTLVLAGASPRRSVRPQPSPLSWSPDGRRLAFTAALGQRRGRDLTFERSDIFTVDATGAGLRRLTRTGDAAAPVWSPDGRVIVYGRSAHQDKLPTTSSLWAMRADGTGARRLTPVVDGQIDAPSSFSPDGATLAFTRARFARPQQDGLIPDTSVIFVMRLGREPRRLTAGAGPVFSPDAQRLAFASSRDNDGIVRVGEDENAPARDLYVTDRDGANVRRITHTRDVNEEYPTFSADSQRIAYQRTVDPFTASLRVVNTDSTCDTSLRSDPRGDIWYYAPAWQPGRARTGGGRLPCHR
jgi:Tol biopolymer transport system component